MIRVPRPLPCELDLTSGAAACGRGRPRLEAAGIMARANSDACGVVGVMWNLWRRRRDSGTPHSSLYARSENSRRNSVLWGLGPSLAPAAPNLWLWEARAQTMRRPLCLHHLPRTRLCVNACISPHTAPEHTGVRRPEMKR